MILVLDRSNIMIVIKLYTLSHTHTIGLGILNITQKLILSFLLVFLIFNLQIIVLLIQQIKEENGRFSTSKIK